MVLLEKEYETPRLTEPLENLLKLSSRLWFTTGTRSGLPLLINLGFVLFTKGFSKPISGRCILLVKPKVKLVPFFNLRCKDTEGTKLLYVRSSVVPCEIKLALMSVLSKRAPALIPQLL